MRKQLAVMAAAVLSVGALGACSNENASEAGSGASSSPSPQTASDTPEEAQAKADIKQGLQQGGFEGAQLSDQQATCFSDGLVDRLGVDKLRQYRLLTKDDQLRIQNPTDLDPADADTLASTFVDCVDVGELVTAAMGEAGQLGSNEKQCIEKAVNQSDLQKALSDSLQGRTPDFGGMQQDLAKCAAAGQG